MDISTMEEKLEDGSYKTLRQFKRDFRLIIDNCKQYNGSDNGNICHYILLVNSQ